jgi:hypothetical protein
MGLVNVENSAFLRAPSAFNTGYWKREFSDRSLIPPKSWIWEEADVKRPCDHPDHGKCRVGQSSRHKLYLVLFWKPQQQVCSELDVI